MSRHAKKLNIVSGMDGIRAEYDMARENRFRRRRVGVSGMGRSADSHFLTETELIKSREYARDMDRNDAVVGPLINMAVTQTIQNGFTLNPMTGDSDCDKLIKDLWYDWSEDPDQCDLMGENTFCRIEQMIFRMMMVDGDVIALGTDRGSLQIMEAHELRTPTKSVRNIVHGVELDDYRKRLRYYFIKSSPDIRRQYERVSDFNIYSARDDENDRQIFHIYHADRVTQTRGVTALKAIVDIATMAGDTVFAQLVKEQFSAMVVGFFERTSDYIADSQMGERSSSTLPDGSSQYVEELQPGLVLKGNKGEKFTLPSANVISQNTMEYVRFLLQVMGMNIGVPLISMTLDASRTSWSGARVDTDTARMGYRTNQHELMNRFHRPVYRWWIKSNLLSNPKLIGYRRKLGDMIFQHDWKPPRWPYIDPLKDTSANALRMSSMQQSPRRIVAENGDDIDDIIRETVADRLNMWDQAFVAYKTLCVKHPEAAKSLTPRDMLNLDLYRGGQVIDSADSENNKDTQNQKAG